MKVDYLSIYFKTSTIPSRTKHEAFKSFGSRAQLLQLFMRNSHFFFEYNEPILSSLFIFHIQKKISKRIINPRPEYSEDSSEQTNNCQQRCFFFFFQIQRIFLNLYVGHRFSIG
jgi:hypothetical protein